MAAPQCCVLDAFARPPKARSAAAASIAAEEDEYEDLLEDSDAFQSLQADWAAAISNWDMQFERQCFVQQQRCTEDREAALKRQREDRERYEAKMRRLQKDIDHWETEERKENSSTAMEGTEPSMVPQNSGLFELPPQSARRSSDPFSGSGTPLTPSLSQTEANNASVSIDGVEDIPRHAMPSTAYVPYLSAMDKFNKRDFSEALRMFNVVAEECDVNSQQIAQVYANRAVCHFCRGKFESCLKDSLSALRIQKNHALSYARAFRCSLALKKVSDARQYLRQLENIPRHTFDIAAEDRIADSVAQYLSCMARQAHDAALNAITEAVVGATPQCISFVIMRIEVLAQLNPDSALEEVNRLLEEKSKVIGDNAELLYWKGFLLYDRACDADNLGIIQSYLLRAISAAENNEHQRSAILLRLLKNIETQCQMSASFVNSKRWREAAGIYTQLLDMDLRNSKLASHFLLQRAHAHRNSGNFDMALKDCSAALDTKVSDRAEVLGLRAEVNKALGNLNNAVKDAEESCTFYSCPAAHERLSKYKAELFQRQRDYEQARREQREREAKERAKEEERIRKEEQQRSQQQQHQQRQQQQQSSSNARSNDRPAKASVDNGLYEALALTKAATAAQIAKAYKQGALRWHPDRWVNATETEKVYAEETFKKINHAYSVLGQEDSRRRYDLTL